MHETQGHHAIRIDELTRVEGQGALYIRVEGGRVAETRFKIFEPPRFFEAFLRGRDLREVPDITARICGICPVAYQMSSCHALESILGALPEPGSAIRDLRRLFYCGEWLESHALHAFFLHLPDFMGRHSAIEIAETHPGMVERGIRLRKAGNAILTTLGGRPMHPVGARVGGWHATPRREALEALRPSLETALEDAVEAARWMHRELTFPDFEQDYEFVALVHPDEYPFNEGRIASSRGWDCPNDAWEEFFEERQVEHSTAYQAVIRDGARPYLLGPLARFSLNYDRLSPRARALAEEIGIGPGLRNPYKSLLVRMVEMAYCCEEALRAIAEYRRPAEPRRPAPSRAGEGAWSTEAPRGLLYHRYRVNDAGLVEEARIVPPTSQNQGRIERDLTALVERSLDRDDHRLSHDCEFMIRNYDPCISCATHFLTFRIDRA